MGNKVGLIGYGAIGSEIANSLLASEIPNIDLVGILDPFVDVPAKNVENLEALLALEPDLIVEAAGHLALKEYASSILDAGIDLLIVSAGALGDESLFSELKKISTAPKTGRLIISNGAIGGFDLINAAELAGKIQTAEIISTKPVENLNIPNLPEEIKNQLKDTKEPVIVYQGKVKDVLKLFPESANVCATFGLATLGFDETTATFIADPNQTEVIHQLKLTGESGSYEFVFQNNQSPKNPKTSAVVPFAVLQALRKWSYLNSSISGQPPYIFL